MSRADSYAAWRAAGELPDNDPPTRVHCERVEVGQRRLAPVGQGNVEVEVLERAPADAVEERYRIRTLATGKVWGWWVKGDTVGQWPLIVGGAP